MSIPIGVLVSKLCVAETKLTLCCLKDLPELVEAGKVAGDAVELVSDDDIDIAGADFAEKRLHAGAFEVLAGESGGVEKGVAVHPSCW